MDPEATGLHGIGVSVVVGTYNGAKFLRSQLDTLFAQTVRPFEIIIRDDASTDGTAAIAEEYAAAQLVPVRVVRNQVNMGFSNNFLAGAEQATGRYIAFCDQDDLWRSNKIERCVRALVESRAVLVTHAVDIVDEGGAQLIAAAADREDVVLEPRAGDPWQDYYGFTMVFDRRLLDLIPASERGPDTHRPDTPLSHDRWLWVLASGLGHVVVVGEVLADYRRHGGQLFGASARRQSWLRDVAGRLEHTARGLSGVPERVTFLAEVAANRAVSFDGISAGALSAAGLREEDAARAADLWRQLATSNELRRSLYAVPRHRRPLRLACLIIAGVYRGSCRGGSGQRFLLQDLLALPLLRRR